MNTVTFAEEEGRTTLTLLIQAANKTSRDAIIESGMEDGLQDALDLLEQVARVRSMTPVERRALDMPDGAQLILGTDFVAVPTHAFDAQLPSTAKCSACRASPATDRCPALSSRPAT